MSKKTPLHELIKGIWDDNPVLVQLLGMCPTLAVTTSAINGMGMALATTFVLICSSILISLLKKAFDKEVRIVGYILIIATFVTLVDLLMKAFFLDLSKALGMFIPLIVVNCVILGRQEAFANKNNVFLSILDAIGMGIGFLIALVSLGMFRELLGNGTIFGQVIFSEAWFSKWIVMILPPGAFFGLGLMIGVKRVIDKQRARG